MRWIAVDGIDGAGKTTCARWIKEYYEGRGRDVELFRHPSNRWVGRLTRRCLRGSGRIMRLLASAFFFLDLVISLCRMREGTEEYDVVIFVRYLMTAAYLPHPLSVPGYKLFTRVMPLPDRLILVDVNPKMALQRILDRDHEEEMFETEPMLNEVRNRMLGLMDRSWYVIDNNGSMTESERRLAKLLSHWEQ